MSNNIKDFLIKHRLFIITGSTILLAGTAVVVIWRFKKSNERKKGHELQMEALENEQKPEKLYIQADKIPNYTSIMLNGQRWTVSHREVTISEVVVEFVKEGSDVKRNDWKEMLVCRFSGGEVTKTLCTDENAVEILLESFQTQVVEKKGSLKLIRKKEREFTIEWNEPLSFEADKPPEYQIYRAVLMKKGLYSFSYVSRDLKNLSEATKLKWAMTLSNLPVIGYDSDEVLIPNRIPIKNPEILIPDGKREVSM